MLMMLFLSRIYDKEAPFITPFEFEWWGPQSKVYENKTSDNAVSFLKVCKEDAIGHKLISPYTPQTNVTIKNAKVKAEEYDNIDDVKKEINKFLIFYNFNRRHGSLRKELKVRIPFEAVQSWFQAKPEIFKILPDVFQDIVFGK